MTETQERVVAALKGMLMQKWVSDGMDVTPHELADFYINMTSSFWRGVSK